MSRPSTEVIGPRFVYRELVKAEEALTAAGRVAEDRVITDAIRAARKDVGRARERARAFLKDADLRTAAQPALFDPTQGD